MHAPENMTEVIRGKRYSTKTATLIAGNDYWDGHNFERAGTNAFLYRTPKGAYFRVDLTQWEGQRDGIEPLSETEALELWETLSERRVEYETAFLGRVAEDA
jgi:hypothetical protein